MTPQDHGSACRYLWVCWIYLGVIHGLMLPLHTSSADSAGAVYNVPYKLKNVTSSSIYLSFTINSEVFSYVLVRHQTTDDTKVYTISNDESLKPSNTTWKDCVDYGGHDSNNSYEVRLCSNLITSGIVVGNQYYLILRRQPLRNLLKVEIQDLSAARKLVTRAIKVPREYRPNSEPRKRKRTAGKAVKITVVVAIFTEHLLYKQYCQRFSPTDVNCARGEAELTEYVRIIAKGADLFYDRIYNVQLRISLQLRAVIHINRSLFYKSELNSSDGKPQVDAAKALQAFSIYQQNYFNKENLTLGRVDQATLITAHELIDERDEKFTTIGVAYVEGICDLIYKSAVCQYKPYDHGWNTVYILAHEIAHNLGAKHDGAYKECSGENNNIMSTHNLKTNVKNIFYFSCCSLTEMLKIIRTRIKDKRCLGWLEPPTTNISARMPGLIYNRALQCKAEFSDEYIPCYSDGFDPYNSTEDEYHASFKNYMKQWEPNAIYSECLVHRCVNPQPGNKCEMSQSHPVLAGTWCDVGKWCIEGQCINRGWTNAGSNTPVCNLDEQELTKPKKINSYKALNTNATGNYNALGDTIGRWAGVAVGCLFFICGVLSAFFDKGRSRGRSRRRSTQNNAAHTTIELAVPKQYEKVIISTHQTGPHYDVKDYDQRISRLMK